jgi:membrane fusion protein (multidrug efflux system)
VESGAVRDTVAVPKAAVQADAEGSFVWVVNEDTAHRRAVETRANSGDRIEITRGLSPGDRVVVRNAQRLRGESAKVRVEE